MKLIDMGREYIRSMSIIEMGLLKLCLFSLGVIAGLLLPKKIYIISLISAAIVFVITIIPILIKLYKISNNKVKI
jgi:hypothetical protein